jgi:hypothetical protein
MKKIGLLSLTLVLCGMAWGQSTLNPGDIAIISMYTDNPDTFAFVLMVDIQAGTVIRFTDAGWLGSGGFRTGAEGCWTYTAPTDLPSGTVISYDTLDAAWTYYTSTIMTGSFSLATAGDQVIAFQGTDAAPTPIYALNNDTTGGNAWQSDATNSNTSALPTGLVNGTSAVGMYPEKDNVGYNGITSGTKAELLAAIGNLANWVGDDAVRPPYPFSFIVTGVTGNPYNPKSAFTFAPITPNPIKASTKIVYSLPQPGKVNLSVFNILGQQVATLVDGNQAAGSHTASWKLRDDKGTMVPNGIYFFKLTANGQTITRRAMVVR